MKQSLLFYKTYPHPTSQEWVVFIHGAGGSSAIWFRQLKAYKAHFNILLIDLRGHGRSNKYGQKAAKLNPYTFSDVSQDVIKVLDHLDLKQCHFVGLSLGTIIVRKLAELDQKRVKSMVLAGAITRLNSRSQWLIRLGNWSKHIIPYMWTYKLFAYVVMPKSTQKQSRNLFIREARKLCQKEFKRWFKMTSELNPLMRYFDEKELQIPTLYLMGEEDYMFIKPIKEMLKRHHYSQLQEIPNCGHVCNVEQAQIFNQSSIKFIQQH